MLKVDELEKTLTALVKGKSDIILYGNKSSGKTYLSRKVLDSVLGKESYVNIKCIFISDRNSLLYLISEELMRVWKNLDSNLSEDKKSPLSNEGNHSSLEAWIKNVNRFMKTNE